MNNRDVWKMLHLLFQHGERGLPARPVESAGFTCGPDAAQDLVDGDAVVRKGKYPRERIALSKAARHILSSCTVANKGPVGGLVRVDLPRAFVIMPFSEPWSDHVYKQLIAKSLRSARLKCVRGDTVLRVRDLTVNVLDEIYQAGLVVAEITKRNVNVFYELALAHALGKDAILLKQKRSRLPADFGGAHYIEYDRANLEKGRQQLTEQLKAWVDIYNPKAVEQLYGSTP